MSKRYMPEEENHVQEFIYGLRPDLPPERDPKNIRRKFDKKFAELSGLLSKSRCAYAASVDLVKAGAAKPFQTDHSILDGVDDAMKSVFCIGTIGMGEEVAALRRKAWEAAHEEA